jgi:hypothetical protein
MGFEGVLPVLVEPLFFADGVFVNGIGGDFVEEFLPGQGLFGSESGLGGRRLDGCRILALLFAEGFEGFALGGATLCSV